jgi:uncharacterized protein (TIGR03435 family)
LREAVGLCIFLASGAACCARCGSPELFRAVPAAFLAASEPSHAAGGTIIPVVANGITTLRANVLSISRLVDQLSRLFGQQVVDQEGLKAAYQWNLQYAPFPGTPGGRPVSPEVAIALNSIWRFADVACFLGYEK